jgi:hypothetical protein
MPEHRRKENDERKKSKIMEREVQKENREHKHTKKMGGNLKIAL